MTNQKRNRSLLISLIALTMVTIGLVAVSNREGGSDLNPDVFAVGNLQEVNKVQLQSRSDTVELEFINGSWQVNGRYKADPNMVKVLFATIAQLKAKRQISGVIGDSVRAALKADGVRVQLFGGGSLLQSFFAGGNDSKTTAYFLSDAEEVYVVSIPGYKVYTAGVFELGETGFRDKLVFNFRWENFKGLKAMFASRPEESFAITMQKDFFTIEGMPATDTTKLYDFLDNVARLTVDGFTTRSKIDSVSANELMKLEVSDIGSRVYELSLYHKPEDGVVYGLMNSQPVYFQVDRIRQIMRGKSFFSKK